MQHRLYAKVLIYILTRPSYEVRSLALAKVKKMNASLGGFQISMTLLQEFKQLLATQKVSMHTCYYVIQVCFNA